MPGPVRTALALSCAGLRGGVLSAYFRRTFGAPGHCEEIGIVPGAVSPCLPPVWSGGWGEGSRALTLVLGGEAGSRRVCGPEGKTGRGCWRVGRGLGSLSWGRRRGRDRRPSDAKTRRKGRGNVGRREFTLSASAVNCWGGQSAPDRQAPREEPSSVRLVM